jgi:hypothetical protein
MPLHTKLADDVTEVDVIIAGGRNHFQVLPLDEIACPACV